MRLAPQSANLSLGVSAMHGLASIDVPTETNFEHPPNFLTPKSTAIVPAIACFTRKCLVRDAARRHSGSEAEDPDALIVAEDDIRDDSS